MILELNDNYVLVEKSTHLSHNFSNSTYFISILISLGYKALFDKEILLIKKKIRCDVLNGLSRELQIKYNLINHCTQMNLYVYEITQ